MASEAFIKKNSLPSLNTMFNQPPSASLAANFSSQLLRKLLHEQLSSSSLPIHILLKPQNAL